MMIPNKTLLVKGLCMAIVGVVLWSFWKRVDAIIDNYQKYYDFALVQKVWDEKDSKFKKDYEKKWNNLSLFTNKAEEENIRTTPKDMNNEEAEKKWQEYEKNAPFTPYNKPVPQVADEYTRGYYRGLWNFFLTGSIARIFLALIFMSTGLFIFRLIWTKVSEKEIEDFLKRF